MKVYAYDPQKGERVTCGTLEGNILYKVVKEKHYCRKHKCYGVQVSALEDAKELGAELVVIDSPEGIFESDITQWFTDAKIDDLGAGKQAFLSMSKMR